ncbi:MAG: non-heme iron oxygenase ferredoxin subunit [Arachnia sp.]
MTFQPAADLDEVTADRPLAAVVDGIRVAIVLDRGQYYAIDDECSHGAVALSEGDVSEGAIECYLHGSVFDLKTGRPRSLPATEAVAVYPCRVAASTIEVDIDNPITYEASQES